MNPKYRCTKCSHEFEKLEELEQEGELRCPRCGSTELEENRFLFGTPSAEGLTYEDYFDACLAPCCGDVRNLRDCSLWSEVKPKEATEK